MKELEEYTFDELVRMGIELELDSVVQGAPLKSRVYRLMELASRWQYQRQVNKPQDKGQKRNEL